MPARAQASTVGPSCAKGRAHSWARMCQESRTCLVLRTPTTTRSCRMRPDCARGPRVAGQVLAAPKGARLGCARAQGYAHAL